MQVMELIPENWSFVMGRQNTVRRGFKWADLLLPREKIRFKCSDGREQLATVTRVTKTSFLLLTDEECSHNHAYSSRSDLLVALIRAYGQFSKYDSVTLIEFSIYEVE